MTTRLTLTLIIGFAAIVQAGDKSIEVTLENTLEPDNVRRSKFEPQKDSKTTCLEAIAREIAQPCFTTLTGFKAAFRKAHDAHDLQQVVRLVRWDRATDTMRSNMCEKLRTSFLCDIESMHFERPNAEDRQYHWNIKPTRVLVVKYYGFPPESGYLLTQWYPLGKKGSGFCFVISNEPWQQRPRLW